MWNSKSSLRIFTIVAPSQKKMLLTAKQDFQKNILEVGVTSKSQY